MDSGVRLLCDTGTLSSLDGQSRNGLLIDPAHEAGSFTLMVAPDVAVREYHTGPYTVLFVTRPHHTQENPE